MVAGWRLQVLDGFAGISKDGLFGTPPSWVNKSKPPGHSSLEEELGLWSLLKRTATLSYFFWSPNLAWFAMTFAVYKLAPYDLNAAAQGFALNWVLKRFMTNFAVALTYYGFFFWALYVKHWAQRKYRPGVYPTAANMVHNTWYWFLGIVQWSVSECLMVRLWATGKAQYVRDEELLQSPGQLLSTLAWVLLIPFWRDIHFYCAHRFSHVRAFYKYVHSLHHRNTDPEPFSGLCMHPVEHLVYFSNALTPSLYLQVSPLIYMWNFMHLAIAPGAGHSGWEDHFQADQYHYLHHAKFECNYGSPSSGWIDQALGTFREKLGESSAYKGEFKDAPQQSKVWSPQGYLGMPQSVDHLLYIIFCIGTTITFLWAAVYNTQSAAPVRHIFGVSTGKFVACLVAYAPVLFALVLSAFFDKMSWRWPFQKEHLFGSFGLCLLAGWTTCLLPVYHFVFAAVSV